MAIRIQLRRDSSADWAAANPVLAKGEPGLDDDVDRLKFGDGFTPWNSLAFSTATNEIERTYVQQTEPTPPSGFGPFIWYQTDPSGNVIDIRKGVA